MLMNDLSIIIPFYNTPINFIDYLIEKSRLESYPQYEIIWIDDGSDFAISNYVKDICLKNNWVYYKFDKNVGVSSARNKGIELSSSNYLMFLDSDDVVDLNQIVSFNFNEKYDIALFKDAIFIDEVKYKTSVLSIVETKQTIDQLYCNDVYRLNLRSSCCKVLKKQIITNNSISFDADLPFYEDAIFMCRYYQYCNNYIALDNTLYYYRIYNGSSSKKYNKDYMRKYEIYYHRFKSEFNNNDNYISGLEQDTFDRMLIDKIIRSIKHGHGLYCFTIIKSVPVRESARWIINNRGKNSFSYKLAILVNKKLYLFAVIKIIFHQLTRSIIIRMKKIKRTTTK